MKSIPCTKTGSEILKHVIHRLEKLTQRYDKYYLERHGHNISRYLITIFSEEFRVIHSQPLTDNRSHQR